MEKYYLGIDLGTSSVRVLLTDLKSRKSWVDARSYDVIKPKNGYAEQDPENWYVCLCTCLRQVIAKSRVLPEEIEALSFSGQMHGTVALDENRKLVSNAIIWMDQRSSDAIREIYDQLGQKTVTDLVQNRISTGFMLSTLYWFKTRRPEQYRRIRYVMLPKDYIKYRLCGKITTDPSDAAGSLAYDSMNMKWSTTLLKELDLNESILPKCLPSTTVVGNITPEAAELTGLCESTLVVNGGADQCMMAVGNGIIEDGIFASNIGTAGQISTTVRNPIYDPLLRTNTFAHVLNDRWNLMGACLNSGISLKWIAKQVLDEVDYESIDCAVKKRPIGGNGLFFLPYLTGERTPHMDSLARGVFFGLTLDHDKISLERAVMEGVIFALKDCFSVLMELDIPCEKIVAAGGGARSDVWLQMQSDVFERPVFRSASDEQASLGAAITAAIGSGAFSNYADACDCCVKKPEIVFYPIKENVTIYREMYPVYRELYRANKHIFCNINEIFNIS